MEPVPTFERDGNLVLFRQFGIKLDFPDDTPNTAYFSWLDSMIESIGDRIPGARIIEKPNDRIDPRRNTGCYYDTEDYRLLHGHMVLRTTSNPKTHAFCAFKHGADEHQVRRDHRYIFDGDDKRTIQLAPTSDEAVATVHRLLARQDIRHPGTFLKEATGIYGEELSPAIRIAQFRYTFYVLLGDEDALRCSLDRVDVTNLRARGSAADGRHFSEIELPIFPRISPATLADARVSRLIATLAESLNERFGGAVVHDAKYRRAARVLKILT